MGDIGVPEVQAVGDFFRTCLLTLLPHLLQLNGGGLGLCIALLPLVLSFWGCASDLPNSTDAQGQRSTNFSESGFRVGTWEAEFSVYFQCRQSALCQAQL